MAFAETKTELVITQHKLSITESSLDKIKATIFKMSGMIWRNFAPMNQWSEEISINGHPFHLMTPLNHQHYQVMINDVVYPNVIEEGDSSFDFPEKVQTIRLMTVDGDGPIFFEVPGF